MKFLGTFTSSGGGATTTRAANAPAGRRPRGEAPGGRRPGFIERVARGAGRVIGRVRRGFRAGMRGA